MFLLFFFLIQNAVRHTLSVNRGRFEKVPREGRPSLWTLTEKYGVNFDTESDVGINNNGLSSMERTTTTTTTTSTVTTMNVGEKHEKEKFTLKNSLSVPLAVEKHMKTSHESLHLPTTPPMTKQHQPFSDVIAAPSTQTIQVVFNDGVVAVVVLPKPLPVCNYGSASDSPLYNSVGQVAGMKVLGSCSRVHFCF